ncbi:signal peptidase I [Corynebacterium sp. TAE3-ERU12]|uniref:signal peptidase I n=1 Tax=Corynebacterium sp. TAE3-ERU12 TaxID=2849491 RepID=UPI001C479513|nr:signal peptidase I [Corynebacterium sp. TAE3-ERU12]MBV7295217.1 signal peptidase I [Corynebacterium sp. TAE3-ERU12]
MTHQSAGAEDNPASDEGQEPEEHSTPWYVEIPIIIVLALLISVGVQTFVGRVYLIPSESMEPTLHGCAGCTGDRIWVDKLAYRFGDPEPGDVVVFNGPESWESAYQVQRSTNPVVNSLQTVGSWVGVVAPAENALVKRVIATGGQTVQCLPGDPGVMVDGAPIDNSFILQPPEYPVDPNAGSDACGGPYFGPLTVPENNLWMMGDNRTNSLDSRYHQGDEYQGSIPESAVVGKVRWRILPISRIGGVDDPDILTD